MAAMRCLGCINPMCLASCSGDTGSPVTETPATGLQNRCVLQDETVCHPLRCHSRCQVSGRLLIDKGPTFGGEPLPERVVAIVHHSGRDSKVDAVHIVAALPTDSDARKEIPLVRGVLDYFPAALAEVAKLSKAGNDKHNPGQDLHWSRGKSGDHADCILRHLAERGVIDTDGLSHSVKVAWRALALLQEELEGCGAPLARGARCSIA